MRRLVIGVGLALVTPVAAIALLAASGGLGGLDVPGLAQPGPLTRIGLPAAQGMRDLSAALTVGLLVLAAFCAPPESVDQRES